MAPINAVASVETACAITQIKHSPPTDLLSIESNHAIKICNTTAKIIPLKAMRNKVKILANTIIYGIFLVKVYSFFIFLMKSIYTKLATSTKLNRSTVWRILNFKVSTDRQTLDKLQAAARELRLPPLRIITIPRLKKSVLDFESPLLRMMRSSTRGW